MPATGGQSPTTTTITSPGHKKKTSFVRLVKELKTPDRADIYLAELPFFSCAWIPWQYEVAAGKSCSCGIIHRCSSVQEDAVEEEVLHDCIITLVSKMLCLCLSDPLVILSRSLAGTSTAYRCAER